MEGGPASGEHGTLTPDFPVFFLLKETTWQRMKESAIAVINQRYTLIPTAVAVRKNVRVRVIKTISTGISGAFLLLHKGVSCTTV